ncbi:MAG: ELWxxDGT repeat protein, partial [Candidatus Limnocylindrales bacterium]
MTHGGPARPTRAGEQSVTPDAWRVAAAGILAGGFAVGLLAGHRRLGKAVPLITAGVALGCAVPVALASRRPPITPEQAARALDDTMPTFSIVVGARDEAGVLRRLVADVSRQDYRALDGSPLFELIVVDDRSTDGTAEGTYGIYTAPTSSPNFSNFLASGNLLFFTCDDGTHGSELWRTDGTAAGTAMVRDINGVTSGSYPGATVDVNGIAYFSATDGQVGYELWRSDGTAGGTWRVKDIATGTNSSSPASLTAMGGLLYFTASDSAHGGELWVSDGTDAGTVLVKDIYSGTSGSSITYMTAIGGKLYFSAYDGFTGYEPW